MTREEAIKILSTRDAHGVLCGYTSGVTEALDMAIETLSQPNYETDTEVRLAVTNRKKEKVILWDAFGEVEYVPSAVPNCQKCAIKESWKATEKEDLVAVVRCKDCKFKSLYDDGDTKYYYCALEDRPNRNWSVDDTDYCSWAERGKPCY